LVCLGTKFGRSHSLPIRQERCLVVVKGHAAATSGSKTTVFHEVFRVGRVHHFVATICHDAVTVRRVVLSLLLLVHGHHGGRSGHGVPLAHFVVVAASALKATPSVGPSNRHLGFWHAAAAPSPSSFWKGDL